MLIKKSQNGDQICWYKKIMDPMKSFEELKFRLQQTLQEVKQETSYFSSTWIQTKKQMQDTFHKFPLTQKKSIRPVNVVRTSQKPKIGNLLKGSIEQQEYHSCGEMTPKSMNWIDEGPLDVSTEYERTSENYNMSTMMKKQKQCNEKCRRVIQRLKIGMEEYKRVIMKNEKEIHKYKYEKVEYEQIIFQLKQSQYLLMNEIKGLNAQLEQLKQVPHKRELQIMCQIIQLQLDNYQYHTHSGLVLRDQSENHSNKYCFQINDKTNFQDLENILSSMKEKVFNYEKQLQHKQTLYNHQHYLLQKLKNEQTQLHSSQASLLQELEYILKKLKTLKKENQEIKTQNQLIKNQIQPLKTQNQQLKTQNQDRIRQAALLQDVNTKLQQDLSQLFIHINELQKQKADLEDKLKDIASVTQQPLRDYQINENKQFQYFSCLNSNEELGKKGALTYVNIFSIDKMNQSHKLKIDDCVKLWIIGGKVGTNELIQKDEILEVIIKDQSSLQNNIFSRSIELDDTFFLNELEISRQKICQLQKKANESKMGQQQAWEQLSKTEAKLRNILKDLKLLESEHQSMKQLHQQQISNLSKQLSEKQQLLLVSFSLAEQQKKQQAQKG